MIKPYTYQLHNNVDEDKLLKNGFKKQGDVYYLKKSIHQHIEEEIEINLNEHTLMCYVKKSGAYYAPFYHPEDNQGSEFCLNLYRKYNFVMDNLCKEGILWRPRRKPQYPKRHKKSNTNKTSDGLYQRQRHKNYTRNKT